MINFFHLWLLQWETGTSPSLVEKASPKSNPLNQCIFQPGGLSLFHAISSVSQRPAIRFIYVFPTLWLPYLFLTAAVLDHCVSYLFANTITELLSLPSTRCHPEISVHVRAARSTPRRLKFNFIYSVNHYSLASQMRLTEIAHCKDGLTILRSNGSRARSLAILEIYGEVKQLTLPHCLASSLRPFHPPPRVWKTDR